MASGNISAKEIIYLLYVSNCLLVFLPVVELVRKVKIIFVLGNNKLIM